MPGFNTHLMDVEVNGNIASVQAYIEWFLENINIHVHCTFPITERVKVKKVDGVDRSVKVKEIKFKEISASCRWTIGEPMIMSIKKKVENSLNPD